MSDFINTIDVLGDDAVIDSIISGTIEEFVDDAITTVGNYALYSCSELKTLDLPNATHINQYAVQKCPKIENINLPNVTSLGRECLCYTATTGVVSKVVFPSVTSASSYVGQFAFNNKILVFPKLKDPGYLPIQAKHLYFPAAEQILAYIGARHYTKAIVFSNTEKMSPMVIAGSFDGTPIYNIYGDTSDGYIFVPRKFLSDDDITMDYRRATNWSKYANKIYPVEDFTVDGTTTGDIATIRKVTNSLKYVTNSNTHPIVGSFYNATLTPEGEFTISSATITMGGVDVTEDVYNSETGEISIPAVTGDIMIIAKANSASSIIVANPATFELGTIGTSDGNEIDSTTRIRSIDYIDQNIVAIYVADGYQFNVSLWKPDGTFAGAYNGATISSDGAWLTEIDLSSVLPYKKRIHIRKPDNSAITVDEAVNITYHLYTGVEYEVIQGYPASADTNSTFTTPTGNGATAVYCEVTPGSIIRVSMTEKTTNRFRIGFSKTPLASGTALYQPIAYDDTALEHTVTVPDGYTYMMVYLGVTPYPAVEPGFQIKVIEPYVDGSADRTLKIEQGSIGWDSSDGGKDKQASNAIRTDFIPFNGSSTVSIFVPNSAATYKVTLRGYDSAKTYQKANGSWITLPGTITFAYPYIRVLIGKTDDSDFDVSSLYGAVLTVDGIDYTLIP